MLSSAVVAFAGRVLSGFESKPIMATGGQHLPVFKNTPSYTHTSMHKLTPTRSQLKHKAKTNTHFLNVLAVEQNSCSCVF